MPQKMNTVIGKRNANRSERNHHVVVTSKFSAIPRPNPSLSVEPNNVIKTLKNSLDKETQ